ncbi:MAG: hypothetical protein Kow00127_00120 [Bacteroidales bacterium]
MKLFNWFRFLFFKPVNILVSRTLRPLAGVLPARLKIPVTGLFRVKAGGAEVKIFGYYTSYITRQLFWCGAGGWESAMTLLWCRLVPHSRVVLDIGANFGWYSLLASKTAPESRIYAFEPFIDARKALEENVKANGSKNITVVPFALGNENIQTTLWYRINPDFPDELQLAGDNTLSADHAARSASADIKVWKLDDWMAENQPGSVDLIKVDAEGFEWEVFKGAQKTLSNHRPVILAELSPGKTLQEVTRFFSEHNYLFYSIGDRIKPVERPADTQGMENYLLVPQEKYTEKEFGLLINQVQKADKRNS